MCAARRKITPAFPAGAPSGRGPEWKQIKGVAGSARTPIPVHFSGTIHSAAVPTRAQRKRAERNAEVLQDAIFILSQSETGRDILTRMTSAGYKIIFDDARTGDRSAGGLCDPDAKAIILSSQDNPEYLALLLGHESVHAVQNSVHNLFPTSGHTPEAGIKVSFAIEADAYAQQVQIALELSLGDAKGPEDQQRYDGPLQEMRMRFPDLVRAAERVLKDRRNLDDGSCVAAAFEAFYSNNFLRSFYEDAHINWADSCARQFRKQKRGGFLTHQFNNAVKSDFIKSRLRHRGAAYLQKHRPDLSLDDARHSGLTAPTLQKIEKFYEEHIGRPRPATIERFGLHLRSDFQWFSILPPPLQAVLKRRQKPPKNDNNQ